MEDNSKHFKILTIDGGGIRGIFPITILAAIENKLKNDGNPNWQIYHHFNLISGTSTGGIIALGLALGVPAQEILDIYKKHASTIFGSPKGFVGNIFRSKHKRNGLEKLLRDTFSQYYDGQDPILKDCKTNICIPMYDLLQGKFSVCKNNYHKRFTRDYHIPAYQVALATSAAPTYFDPYSAEYIDLDGNQKTFNNKVDGGVAANNPTLLAIIEAQTAFYKQLSDLKILSIGTGTQKFSDGKNRKRWGLHYWMVNAKKKRLIDLFFQAQAQNVENLISLLCNGIDKENAESPAFIYRRITKELDETMALAMDETNIDKLNKLSEIAHFEYTNVASDIIKTFFENDEQ